MRLNKFWCSVCLCFGMAASSARADLHAYVKKPDDTFRWEQEAKTEALGVTIYTLKVNSQTWQGMLWQHRLEIIEPTGMKLDHPDTAIIYIGGGSNGDTPRGGDRLVGAALAKAARARVAVLNHVPNQPLLGNLKEDALIAETFIRYLKTKDLSWPLLFPMAKSAVKAMDAVSLWAKANDQPEISKFVVSGASKRGWTTWLSGAADPRVIAIAPMVIDVLNLTAQGENQLKVWGKYSEQIHDYVERGLMQTANTNEGSTLWKMVDPFTYRDGRLATIPKIMINGTNDRYWTQDASRLYFPELKGPKGICSLPNAGHGLEQNREWALETVAGLYRLACDGKKLPEVSWQLIEKADSPEYGIAVMANQKPKSVNVWTATSKNRDVRSAKWEKADVKIDEKDGKMVAMRKKPASGVEVMMIELAYEVDGVTMHLCTQISESDRSEVPAALQQVPGVKAASR